MKRILVLIMFIISSNLFSQSLEKKKVYTPIKVLYSNVTLGELSEKGNKYDLEENSEEYNYVIFNYGGANNIKLVGMNPDVVEQEVMIIYNIVMDKEDVKYQYGVGSLIDGRAVSVVLGDGILAITIRGSLIVLNK